MKRNQTLIRLGPRIKLFRRQLREWNTLLVHQKQVRLLTKEHEEQQVKYYPESRLAVIQRITDQALRLAELMEHQSVERGQLRGRHQEEELILEQAIDTH